MFTTFVFHRIVDQHQEHWTDVSLDTLKHLIQFMSNKRIPSVDAQNQRKKDGICLSFDDGNVSDYDIVLPMLLELKMHRCVTKK